MRTRSTPVNKSWLRRKLHLCDQCLEGKSAKQTGSISRPRRVTRILPIGITPEEIRPRKIHSGKVIRNVEARPHSPTPELRGWFVEPAGPCNQILHTSRCKKRTRSLKALHPEVLRISNDASLSKLSCLLRFGEQSDRTDPGHCGKSAAT